MIFRKDKSVDSGAEADLTSSQEMRAMAEALSHYRSAMRHLTEQQLARPIASPPARSRSLRMRLVLVPALGAALAAAVIAPVVSHMHKPAAKPAVAQAIAPADTANVASVDDTQLMNQIDSDLTEDVPDALQPLADLSNQSATSTKTAGTEKK
jgi:hypothetical protein